MIRRILISMVCAILLVGNEALAHHNMTALFDFNDRVTLKGTLTKVDWRNPHTYLTDRRARAPVRRKAGRPKGLPLHGFEFATSGKSRLRGQSRKHPQALELSRARDKSRLRTHPHHHHCARRPRHLRVSSKLLN